nr:TIGR03936 family radical SAM-associated protein [Angustibacter aerolatus]
MCGLPTETDEDVLQIAEMAKRVIETGRRVSGQNDIRCTVSIGGFVPKPHTPFQWASQADHETTDHRLRLLRDAVRADKKYGRSIGFRYHDGKPGIVEGLLSRGDRRTGRIIEQVWRDGGRFDGWSEHFSYDRWMTAAETALAGTGVDVAWYTTREREQSEVLPWDHLDSGLDKDWLWEDWQDALSEVEVDDCRWTPCFDCGVCPQARHRDPDRPDEPADAAAHRHRPAPDAARPAAQVVPARTPDGPPPPPVVQKVRLEYAKRGRLRFSSHRDFQRALERALRRSDVPMAYSAGFHPHPRISFAGAAPTGTASEAEYVEPVVRRAVRRRGGAGRAGRRAARRARRAARGRGAAGGAGRPARGQRVAAHAARGHPRAGRAAAGRVRRGAQRAGRAAHQAGPAHARRPRAGGLARAGRRRRPRRGRPGRRGRAAPGRAARDPDRAPDRGARRADLARAAGGRPAAGRAAAAGPAGRRPGHRPAGLGAPSAGRSGCPAGDCAILREVERPVTPAARPDDCLPRARTAGPRGPHPVSVRRARGWNARGDDGLATPREGATAVGGVRPHAPARTAGRR